MQQGRLSQSPRQGTSSPFLGHGGGARLPGTQEDLQGACLAAGHENSLWFSSRAKWPLLLQSSLGEPGAWKQEARGRRAQRSLSIFASTLPTLLRGGRQCRQPSSSIPRARPGSLLEPGMQITICAAPSLAPRNLSARFIQPAQPYSGGIQEADAPQSRL